MRVAIRVDAAVTIGTGHVMRCLAIAAALRERGAAVTFVCREQEGNLCDLIEAQRFAVHRLSSMEPADPDWRRDAEQSRAVFADAPADWLIVDHYRLDRHWETLMRASCARVLAIDDLADREHDCDVLLDQNYCEEMNGRYRGLVPSQCRLLLGPDYALLRPEFMLERDKIRQRGGALRRILVFFGGSDPANETAKALEGIRRLNRPGIAIDVVIGSSNPHREQIKLLCDGLPNANYHCQVSNMAQLMAQADLALGAGGTTTWERCCLGLPALVSILADNQSELTKAVAGFGASINLGWFDRLTPESYRVGVESLTAQQLQEMEQRCATLVDGKGTERVADCLGDFRK